MSDCGGGVHTGILYTSRETHYSVMKAARMYRMDAVEVRQSLRSQVSFRIAARWLLTLWNCRQVHI